MKSLFLVPGLVSYHYVSHRYDKTFTMNYLTKVGSTK